MSARRQLGDFELTFVSDGSYFLDGGQVFSIVPKALWQKKVPSDDRNRVRVGLNSVVVRAGREVVLIETGLGNKLSEKQRAIYEPQARLLESLRAAGLRPQEITAVINSHLHFDHCGWNTVLERGEAVPTFPNARYYAPQGEWEAAQQHRERDAVTYIDANFIRLVESGQMRLLEKDSEILPGISLRIYPGHTRSMMAVVLESGGQTACYISDLVPTTAHLDLTWSLSFDLYPLEVIESKKRFYRQAIPGKWLVLFTHDPQAPFAFLGQDEQGRVMALPAE